VTHAAVRAFARGDVDVDNAKYRRPLEASARALLAEIGPDCDVVLLGSVASPKYVTVLGRIFGERLKFPIAFVGRGDMSRGGLLLRHAREASSSTTSRCSAPSPRRAPPKLPPIKWAPSAHGSARLDAREDLAFDARDAAAGRPA
jgi:hypothetical protein